MTFVVLVGESHHAPGRVVGPFTDEAVASDWAQTQPGPPERYAVVVELAPPD